MSDQETAQRYPLAWPMGWKRTRLRRRGHFKSGKSATGYRSDIGVPAAVSRLVKELDRLGVDPGDVVLSTNLRVRIDGTVVANAGEPHDPGAAVYFRYKKRATVFACDAYYRVADNIAAIAAHIEALRAIERHGVGTIEQAMAGYRSLPADTAADWRSVFGFPAGQRVSAAELDSAFKERARSAHPDKGGSDAAMAHVNRAREFALQEIGG